MTPPTGIDDRPEIGTALVRRLVDAQFPQWAGLSLTRVEPAGSDHVIHRLGDGLAVRLPCHRGAVGQAAKEMEWLPRLAPHLPLAVPAPVAVGAPGFGYPWPWAVARWLDGEVATVDALSHSRPAAIAMARFLRALRSVPVPGGGPGLIERDEATRAAIAETAGVFDAPAMTDLWDAALAAPPWGRDPVWVHGDLHTGNLLTDGGRLSAVIDFGNLGAGDPACDLTIAFTLMSPACRTAFRDALATDEATWTRGRGWALSTGLNALTHYADDARVVAQTTRQITQALLG
ncbi:aminoglycoside phosphotransferase family protein [Streptomyces montanisoli]|uniref:Aminoglycoside phosphotransferase family protein n=1 Tax=Streptomyces montanisoli TaxID=2798581 RepID=A0A940MAH6_9ACTN|nr:aminoglycoside phosphotransferase family protein [Streptomyces montanisoli]MBP0456896.1 aminoglycoside phosphotransferase family protein [Streptomyces montanisoli]